MSEKLTVGIMYNPETGGCEAYGDANIQGTQEIISLWLESRVGSGKDTSPGIERDVYEIEIDWYPENDRLTCRHNCGNSGLREGILMAAMKDLRMRTEGE